LVKKILWKEEDIKEETKNPKKIYDRGDTNPDFIKLIFNR
jgi:hypothetical protein